MPTATVGDYVTVDELAVFLKLDTVGSPAVAARAVAVARLANEIVFAAVGQAGADAYLQPPVDPAVYPAAATESALAIAVDLWRRPTAPGGFVQVAGDYVGRLAADPTSPVLAQLSLLRLSWAIS